MTQLFDLNATTLQKLLLQKKCSATEITESCCGRIEALEPQVKAFVQFDLAAALKQARSLDSAERKGPLHGIPVAIKDTIDAAGFVCSWGTLIHAHRVPSRDASVVRWLREAGAVIVGTTVSTEYAIARSGPTRNPHDLNRTPGGSSSGSGAAVAANMVPIAVGTQTVGSIVRPSTHCGIYGYKPSVGAISTEGVMPIFPMFDSVGPMARCLDDIELFNSVMTFANGPAPSPQRPVAGRPIVLIDGPYTDRIEAGTAAALQEAAAIFKAAGHPVVAHELPDEFNSLTHCFDALVFQSVAAEHGRDRDEHGDMMSDRFLEIVDRGRAVTEAEHQAALAQRQFYREYFNKLLDRDGIILAPATDGVAPAFSERTGDQKIQSLWSVVGFPALAVPCTPVGGLPVGVQLVSASGQDGLVLGAGRVLESHLVSDTVS